MEKTKKDGTWIQRSKDRKDGEGEFTNGEKVWVLINEDKKIYRLDPLNYGNHIPLKRNARWIPGVISGGSLSSGYKIKSEVVDVPNKKTSRYPNFEGDLNAVHYKRIRRRHIPKKSIESPLNNIWLNAMCDKSVDQAATIFHATFGVCQHKNTGVLMRQHNTKEKCDTAGGSWESADTKPYWRPYGCCAHGDCEGSTSYNVTMGDILIVLKQKRQRQ